MYKLLVYAYRDWSFENFRPVLPYFDCTRWWLEKGDKPDFSKFDAIVTCEPHIEGWKLVRNEIPSKIKTIGLQQSLYWSENINPRANWNCDMFMMYGEQQHEVNKRHKWPKEKMCITGNPRYDELWNMQTEDHGYTLVLLRSNEGPQFYKRHVNFSEYTILRAAPTRMKNWTLTGTIEVIRCAEKVAFTVTSAGMIAMIMKKPVRIVPLEDNAWWKEMTYHKSVLYNERKLQPWGTDMNFVKWAVTGPSATQKVVNCITKVIEK